MKLLAALLLSLSLAAEGRLLIQPHPGADLPAVLAPHGGTVRARILDVYVVDLPEHASEHAVAALLAHHPGIRFAELDRLLEPAMLVSDPGYASQWHLQTMQAPIAWDYSIGEGITVAVLDTGVDASHPDLAGRIVPGWNFHDGNSDTSDVYPYYGHGTPVAGAVAAACNNGLGVASIACGALILPVRISQADGWAWTSVIAMGIVWAADRGARVANVSYVITGDSTIQAATAYMRSRGGVVVSAAGNGGGYSPLPDDEVITVGATDSADMRASWSGYGPYVDLSAPGVAILTTVKGGDYWGMSGTGSAAPLVAGTIALMLSANPDLTPEQVEIILRATAINGRVDALEAVRASVDRFYPTEVPKPPKGRKPRDSSNRQ